VEFKIPPELFFIIVSERFLDLRQHDYFIIITELAFTKAYASSPTLSPSLLTELVVMVEHTSCPPTSSITSEEIPSDFMFLIRPFNWLRALICMLSLLWFIYCQLFFEFMYIACKNKKNIVESKGKKYNQAIESIDQIQTKHISYQHAYNEPRVFTTKEILVKRQGLKPNQATFKISFLYPFNL